MSHRKQKVFLGSSYSELKETTAGVPQGSVLGPFLFLIYFNDIANNLLSIARLFTDDTSLSFSARSLQDIEGVLSHDLTIVAEWAKQWLVNFNPNKTEAMLFTLQNIVDFPNLIFDAVPVNFVSQHRHLGVTFSENAKWHDQINNIVASASKILGSMRKIIYLLSRKAINQVYTSFLRPILEYASVVWDNCTAYEKDTLEKNNMMRHVL